MYIKTVFHRRIGRYFKVGRGGKGFYNGGPLAFGQVRAGRGGGGDPFIREGSGVTLALLK